MHQEFEIDDFLIPSLWGFAWLTKGTLFFYGMAHGMPDTHSRYGLFLLPFILNFLL